MAELANEPGRMSEAGRLAGVFWEPRPVFADLAAHPRWLVPVVIVIILSLCYVGAFSHRVGWEGYLQQQLDRQAQTSQRLSQLSPEQREAAMDMQLKIVPILMYAAFGLGVPVSMLVIAAILLGMFRLLGGVPLRFGQVFSVVCYGFLPSGLKHILSLVVLFLKNPEDFDFQHPVPTSIGAFLDPQGTAAWLRTLGTSIDLVTIWTLLLVAFGLSVAAKKVSFGRSLWLVALPWAVFTLAAAGVVGAFS